MNGIDLSYYQRNTYQDLINSLNPDFIIVRAGWRYVVDSYCDKIYQYAKSKGKKLGFYFFPLTSDGSAEAHADWAYKQVVGYIGEAIPILDWESYKGAEGHNDQSQVEWALAWLKRFEGLSGVKPMIYMNSNCNALYNWQSVIDNNNGLWVANYGVNNGVDHGRPAVKFWKSAAMHQYTSNPIDKDTFYGDETAWEAYTKIRKNVETLTPSNSPAKTYTQLEMEKLLQEQASLYENKIKVITELQNLTKTKLTTCENVIKDVQEGMNGILNYKIGS